MMDNNENNKSYDTQLIPGFFLMQFEALCHYNLLKSLVVLFRSKEKKPQFGCQVGLNAYISFGHQLIASVFLYESIKLFSMFSEKGTKVFTDQIYYEDLKVVRNNIHTFFKQGGFSKKANNISDDKLKEYKLDNPDWLYLLRNDISLVFQIENNYRQFIGCDYFIYHCIFESDKKSWSGVDYQNYAEFISSSIKAIALTTDETQYHLPALIINKNQPQIELFDYKSADMYCGSKVSKTSTFRLTLMLFQISSALLMSENIFEENTIVANDLWLCFFTKYLAIAYDEAFDNLKSISKFSSKDDKQSLSNYLSECTLNIEALDCEEFARNLRNTIHYQNIKLDKDKIFGTSTADTIIAIYLSNTHSKNMNEFRAKSIRMIEEMKSLQKTIRKIIAVDKEY